MNNDMHETVRLPRGAERDQLFLKLHKQGLNLCEIEWKTGWGMEAVRKALHRQGVSWPRRADAKKPGPKPSDAMVDALCNACGNVRTAKAAYLGLGSGHRPLRCDVCGRATEHFRAPTEFESDWRESLNAEQNKKSAPLRAVAEHRYDPWADARQRFPEWRFEVKPLDNDAPEIISHRRKLVQLDAHYHSRDPEFTMAHVIAHLDEHRDAGPRLSADVCAQADYYAMVRLDRESNREGWEL
jgi:hypothetical protein